MISARNLERYPRTRALIADDVLEFHAARLILLFHVCGTDGCINGLTKMAKLDFFVRYPGFFEVVRARLLGHEEPEVVREPSVESTMVRYHYGPWDHRYYQVLGYLESREVLSIQRKGSSFVFELTEVGERLARQLERHADFARLATQMADVKRVVGSMRGNQLKSLVYETFQKQVAERRLGEVILA